MMAPIDVERLRADTPGTAKIRHFNNAGSGLMSRRTLAAIIAQLDHEAEMGQMEAGAKFDDADLYALAARLLNAQPHEMAIIESHSRGFSAALGRLTFNAGDRILVTRAEWSGNVIALSDIAQRHGATVEVMPVDVDGVADVAATAERMDRRVKLMCITWCPANGGLINPAAELVALGRQAGALTIVDASQAIGQMPVDVRQLDCDVLSAPGRKFLRAPRGTGLLYVAERAFEQLAPAVLDNWSGTVTGAQRFENPDMPPALKAGLAVAIEDTLSLGPAAIAQRVSYLANRIRVGLAAIPGVICHDLGKEKSALISLAIEGKSAAEVRNDLAAQHITVGMNDRTYTPFDMAARNLDEIVRVSPHIYTIEADIDALLLAIGRISTPAKRHVTWISK
jgi:selenocysteine lyase/cysteine desulfurase